MAAAPGNDDDRTILVRGPRPGHGRPVWPGVLAVTALVIAVGSGAWTLLRPMPAPMLAPVPVPVPGPGPTAPAPAPVVPASAMPAPPAAAAAAALPLADEHGILASHADRLTVFRFRPSPAILVMVFPSLHMQGAMLNRLGAFVEKAGLPRDRVLGDVALTQAIAGAHDTPDTYYYGNDYQASDLARFFDTARSDGIALDDDEMRLHDMLDTAGMLAPGAVGALISLTNAGPRVDERARATILRHELSHGLFFTSPAYAEYAQRFWDRVLTRGERAHFVRFLGGQGYDTGNETLMLNETQAYLVHTADPRFFNARAVEMSEAEIARLRADFVRDMPPGWLRDRTQP